MTKLSASEKDNHDFIEMAFDLHEQGWERTANRLIKNMKGNWGSPFSKYNKLPINEPFSLVNLILPTFIFQQPYVTTKAKNAKFFKMQKEGEWRQVDAGKIARNMEAVINNHVNKIKQIYEDRKAVQDALFYPFGVTKDGYSFETVSKGDKDFVSKDTGFHKRINPRDFGWHPMATSPQDSCKLVHRIVMTKSRCKELGINVSELEAGIPDYFSKKFKTKNKIKTKDDFYTFYEVHDQEADKIYLFGGENKKLVEKKDRLYAYNGSDFNVITFTKDNDDFEGVPMLAMVEPQFRVLNMLFEMMVEHFRKFPGQVFAGKEAVDEDQLEQIRTAMQGSVNIVNDINGIMRTAPLQMGSEYFSVFNLVLNIIDRTLGIPDFKRMSGSGRKSATEASFIQGDATVRRNYFMGIVKDFVLEGIEKQAALKQQFQDEKEVIQASGELQFDLFQLSKEDIQGEFVFDFDIENMAASNEAQMNNLNNLLSIMGANPFFQPVLAELDPFKFGKKVFKLVKVNYESMTKDGVLDIVMYSQEKELEFVLRGDLMPRPVEGEDYDAHIKVLREFIENRVKDLKEKAPRDPVLAQVIEHLAETEALKSKQASQPQAQQQPQSPEMSESDMMEPEGPRGPMREMPM